MPAFRGGEVYTDFTANLTPLKKGAKEAPRILAKSGKDSDKSFRAGFKARKIGKDSARDLSRGFKAKQVGKDIGVKMGKAAKSGFKAGAKGLGIGTIGVVGTVAALGVVVKKSLDTAKEIRNLSNIAGVSAQRFQELAFGAEKYGISSEKLSDILKDTNDKFSDFFQTGAGPVSDFFENIAPKVGLTESAFRGLSSEQALGKYVKALEDANLSQEDMTFYLEAIASDSTALLPLLKNNGAEMNSMATEANNLGLVMSNDLVANGADAADTLDKLGRTIKGNVTRTIVEFAPEIEALTTRIIELIPAIVDWADEAIEGFLNIGDAIDALKGRDISLPVPSGIDSTERRLERLKKTLKDVQEFDAKSIDPTTVITGTSALGLEIERLLGDKSKGRFFKTIGGSIDALKDEISLVEQELEAAVFLEPIETKVATPTSGSTPDTGLSIARQKQADAEAAKLARASSTRQNKEIAEFKRRSQIAQQALVERINAAKDLYDQSRTPQEQYMARLTELAAVEADVFLSDAAGGPETFSRLRVQALEETANATDDYEGAITQLVDANNQGLVSSEDFAAGFQILTNEIEPAGAALERLSGLASDGVLNAQSTAQARDAIRDSADYLDDIAESKLAALEIQAREIEGELILAELRGSEVDIEGLERRLAVINETIDLINQGVDPETAEKDAGIFVDAQDQARAQGELKSVFKGAFRAALDGNFESFLSNKLKNAAANMFDRALDSLLDGLFAGLGGLFKGGGAPGIITGIFGGFGGGLATGGRAKQGYFYEVNERGQEFLAPIGQDLNVLPKLPELDAGAGFSIAGLNNGGARGGDTTITMHNHGLSDVRSFQKSQGTIESDMAAAMRRAQADF